MRRPIVAGNWKMNTSLDEAVGLVSELVSLIGGLDEVERVVIPPFPWIVPVRQRLADSEIRLGAQDCAVEDKGAFTGEVSAQMLASWCDYIIVGHSERRHILGEGDELVAAKLRAVLRNGPAPILCVGELLEEREAGTANSVVERQLRAALEGLSEADLARVVIAYEPVWAIGTGRAATPADAQQMAAHVRAVIADIASQELAGALRVQYGGSVSSANAREILELPDVDGALVGGASLRAGEFASIVQAAQAAKSPT